MATRMSVGSTLLLLTCALAILLGTGLLRCLQAAEIAPVPAAAGQTERDAIRPPPTPAGTDDVVDPNTGIRFVVAKTIAGPSDIIEGQDRVTMSPNGKFLLWNGCVVPLDGSPAFTLKELQGSGVDSWSASWSPDGQQIAFNTQGVAILPVSPETGRPTGAVRKVLEGRGRWLLGRIYWTADSQRILFVTLNRQMRPEAGSVTLRDGRLDKHPDYAEFGLVSPDGKTVAYSLPQDGIWAKPVGGGAALIARARSGGWLYDDPELWTSDSQWVASAVDGWFRQEIHFARLSDGHNLDVLPPEAVGTFVDRSKDGKKLLFYRSAFELRTAPKAVPVSGGVASSMGPLAGLDDIQDLSWTADSASLGLLGNDKEGRQQLLWSIPLAGTARIRFNMDTLGADEPSLWSLSPDGTKLFCGRWPGWDQGIREQDLYVIPISLKDGRATGPATLLARRWRPTNPALTERIGAWSSDGTRIALPQKGDQGYELWVLFADGSTPVRIAQVPDEVRPCPQWSPDGKMIAFNLIAADRERVQVIAAEGGTTRTLITMPKGQSAAPSGWSPDSKEVVIACDATISGFPVTGGSARVVVRLQEAGYEGVSWLSWSPDGQRLAFYGGKRGEPSRLCLFSPSTGKIDELENSPKNAWSFVWSPDSRTICCVAEEPVKMRPAGVLRELDVAEVVQKAPPVAEKKPPQINPAPAAELVTGPVFSDNFDTGPSKYWRIVDSNKEASPPPGHAVENGQLMLSNSSFRLHPIDWTDYIVTVRVCVKESVASGEGVCGVYARTTPSNFGIRNMDRYQLAIVCNNNVPEKLYLGINYRDASNTAHEAQMDGSPCSLVRDKWYTLGFEVRGRHLRGYLDGKLMVEAIDARLLKGGVWLGAWRSRALFDDFSARQLP